MRPQNNAAPGAAGADQEQTEKRETPGNTRPPVAPDQGKIRRALGVLFDPNDVIELRAIFQKGRKRVDAGYFDGENRGALVEAACTLNRDGAAVYVTLNRINPQLLSRYANRVQRDAPATTADANVTRRRWLLIDLDPVRPKDTSATAAQLASAKELMHKVRQFLGERGWPQPVLAASGNGYHLLFPIDLPNDDPSRDAITGALVGLAMCFDTDAVKIDRGVFNAARIVKLYGTVANKGDNTRLAPWRLSRLAPKSRRADTNVTIEQLLAIAPEAPKREQQRAGAGSIPPFDLDGFLGRLGIEYSADIHDGSERFKLERCPFNPDHVNGEAAIFRTPDGALGFKCFHNSCADRRWRDVRELVDGPRETRQADGGRFGADGGETHSSALVLLAGESVHPEPISWLWKDWLAQGKLHILAGAPGTGKTTIALALAATVTSGGRWPDGSRASAGSVLMASFEDDPADTLAPRLIAMGADMTRIKFLSAVREGDKLRSLHAGDHASLLAEAIRDHDVRLVIVDPIISALGSFDSHKNAETRQALQPFADVAADTGAALLGIAHFSKGTAGREPLERVSGSLAFGALARVVLGAARIKTEGEGERRLFLRLKSNIGPDTGGYEYVLQQDELRSHPGVFASRVLWGAAVEGSAMELLAEAEAVDDGEGGALADAKRFLADLLADGSVPTKAIRADADGAGFSWRTIQRAQSELGIEAVRDGFGKGGAWTWKLPSGHRAPKDAIDVQQKELASFGKVGALWADGPIPENDDSERVEVDA